MAVRFVVLCLIGVFVSSAHGQDLAIQHRPGNPGASAPVAVAAGGAGDEDEGSYESLKQGRVVAAQSRKTITTVTTSTSSVAATCATTINTVACRRKRRSTFLGSDRRIRSAFVQNPVESAAGSAALDGSLDTTTSLDSEDNGDERSDKEGKLAYTVWWSTTSTYTVTSLANNGITVSVSYFCSVVGAAYPPICG